jgi:hypothetical protein
LYSRSWEQVPLYNGFRIEGVGVRKLKEEEKTSITFGNSDKNVDI